MRKLLLAASLAATLSLFGCAGKAANKGGGESAADSDSAFTDPRDGKRYRKTAAGGQVWLAENLNYETGGSKCYDDSPDSCAKYGRLYNWGEALKVCPAGWRLPSDKEWDALVDYAGGVETAGAKLKSSSDNCGGADDYGFSAMPGGVVASLSGDFNKAGNYGYWWSATEYDSSYAWYRSIACDTVAVYRNLSYKTFLFSVRCLLDG